LKKSSTKCRWSRQAELPTRYGRSPLRIQGPGAQEEAVALVRGDLKTKTARSVRVHSQCLTGDVFHVAALRLPRAARMSLKKIGQAPSGILVIFRRKPRIGLYEQARVLPTAGRRAWTRRGQ